MSFERGFIFLEPDGIEPFVPPARVATQELVVISADIISAVDTMMGNRIDHLTDEQLAFLQSVCQLESRAMHQWVSGPLYSRLPRSEQARVAAHKMRSHVASLLLQSRREQHRALPDSQAMIDRPEDFKFIMRQAQLGADELPQNRSLVAPVHGFVIAASEFMPLFAEENDGSLRGIEPLRQLQALEAPVIQETSEAE